MTRPPCVRLCPANPGNPRTRIEGESPPQEKGHTVFAALAMTPKHTFTSSRRDAPEALMNLPPKEGVGNAGCPLHPQPRVRLALVKITRVNEYTGITRHSRTQWF